MMGLGAICQGKQKGGDRKQGVCQQVWQCESIHKTHMVGREAILTGKQLFKNLKNN